MPPPTDSPSPPTGNTPKDKAPATPRSLRNFFKFIAVGLTGFGVLSGGVALLVEVGGVREQTSFGIMIILVMAMTFFVNRRFIFPAGRTGEPARQAIRFLVVALSSRVVEYYGFDFLIVHEIVHYFWAIVIVSALSYLAKYYAFSAWVFR